MTYEELIYLKDAFSGITINLDHEICATCQNYDLCHCHCNCLGIGTRIDFICDYYIRKRSGQYRRKRAKYRKRRDDK